MFKNKNSTLQLKKLGQKMLKESRKFALSSTSNIQKSWQHFSNFIKKNEVLLFSLFLTLVALLGFLNLIFTAKIVRLEGEYVGPGLIIVYFVSLYIYLSKKTWPKAQKIATFLQSTLVLLFSLAYIFRLNSTPLNIGEISLSTNLVFVALTGLILAINLNLFKQKMLPLYLLLPQIILFALCAFSWVNFLQVDRTNLRFFSQNWLTRLFTINSNVWLGLTTFGIALVSILNLKLEPKNTFLFTFILFFFSFQSIFLLNLFQISYWHQTILFLIVWDFVFGIIKPNSAELKQLDQKNKNRLSAVYHLLLFVLVWQFAF